MTLLDPTTITNYRRVEAKDKRFTMPLIGTANNHLNRDFYIKFTTQ